MKTTTFKIVFFHLLWSLVFILCLFYMNVGYQRLIKSDELDLINHIRLSFFVPLIRHVVLNGVAITASIAYLKMLKILKVKRQKLFCILSGVVLLIIVVVYNNYFYLFVSLMEPGLQTSYFLTVTGILNIALGLINK